MEKADGKSHKSKAKKCYHWWLKRWKARLERRKGKKCPDCKPGYNKYKGYEL